MCGAIPGHHYNDINYLIIGNPNTLVRHFCLGLTIQLSVVAYLGHPTQGKHKCDSQSSVDPNNHQTSVTRAVARTRLGASG